jgi:uncharacterized membrane protein YkoI
MRDLSRIVIVSVSLFASAAFVSADTPVKMADLPAAVQKTVKEQSAGGTIRGLSKETEHGKTTYEAELTINGQKKDIEMDAAGNVLEAEDEVTIADIPAAARAAIEKSAGSGKVLKVEAVTQHGQVTAYEAVVQKTANGKKSEVRVDANGKPVPEN